ncbi:hypothetical protein QJS66_07325 [Kocuria rhizophila]|nr:hypothetical protein QJS66_07325 [Kocuria rhizophila]
MQELLAGGAGRGRRPGAGAARSDAGGLRGGDQVLGRRHGPPRSTSRRRRPSRRCCGNAGRTPSRVRSPAPGRRCSAPGCDGPWTPWTAPPTSSGHRLLRYVGGGVRRAGETGSWESSMHQPSAGCVLRHHGPGAWVRRQGRDTRLSWLVPGRRGRSTARCSPTTPRRVVNSSDLPGHHGGLLGHATAGAASLDLLHGRGDGTLDGYGMGAARARLGGRRADRPRGGKRRAHRPISPPRRHRVTSPTATQRPSLSGSGGQTRRPVWPA